MKLQKTSLLATGSLLSALLSFDEACAKPTSRRISRILLWIAALLTLALAVFPYFIPYLSF
ncbi:MAG: hypothetical protein ACREOI_02750 [bacterium]